MVRTPIVKDLFPAMRSSIRIAKRGNKGRRCSVSLSIQLPSQRAEIHKYARREFARSCFCRDMNGMETWKSSMSKRGAQRSGFADWRDSNAPTT
jgi:hypothetical protein